MSAKWQRRIFLTATQSGIVERVGWVYRGVGIRPTSAKRWSLTHVGTGHRLCCIDAIDPIPIATEIAEAIDWDYNSLDGWKNVAPDMPQKFNAILDRHAQIKLMGGAESPEKAREIAALRA